VEHRLIGPSTASDRMSVAEMLTAMEQLSESERVAVLDAAHLGNGDELVVRLGESTRRNIVRALRRLASKSV
jgi:cell division inhibitor SulA